jgi:hypothetical protein
MAGEGEVSGYSQPPAPGADDGECQLPRSVRFLSQGYQSWPPASPVPQKNSVPSCTTARVAAGKSKRKAIRRCTGARSLVGSLAPEDSGSLQYTSLVPAASPDAHRNAAESPEWRSDKRLRQMAQVGFSK